jgi:Tfp pilus assembly protein PilF
MQSYHPDNEALYWKEAQYYLAYDSLASAKRVLLEAIMSDSSRYELKGKLADLYFEIGKLDSSQMLTENILSHDSTLIRDHIRLGEIYDKKNFLGKSLSSYRAALSIDSTSEIAALGETKVLRKLAYLRALRESKEQLPKIDNLIPKKN